VRRHSSRSKAMTMSIRSGGHRIDWPLMGRTPIFWGPDPRGEASGVNISPHLSPNIGALGPVPSNGDVADPKTYSSPTWVNLPSAEFGRCPSNGATLRVYIWRSAEQIAASVQPFKVTHGHRKWHESIRYPTIFY